MKAQTVTRRYLRVRSAIALGILLLSAIAALVVMGIGRQDAARRGAAIRSFDAALIATSQATAIFENFLHDDGVINRTALRSDMRLLADDLAEAFRRADALRREGGLAEATHAIAGHVSLDPIGLLEELSVVAGRIAEGDQPSRMEERLGAVGVQISARLLPVLLRMKETERAAGAAAGKRAEDFGLAALAVSIAAILATVFFVHLPMERRILASQAAIAEGRRRAEEALEAKSRFLATMSHEIRTPMNGVLGMAELMAASDLKPAQREMVETMRGSGRAMVDIIDDILDHAKLEAGKMSFHAAPFDCAALCADVIRLFSGQATCKGLKLSLSITPEAGPWMRRGDAKAVRQILSNLVGNAIKFTDAGEVSLSLAAAASGGVEITVRDQGVGIPEDAQARIFDDFTQAEDTTDRTYGGTGLGLSIVKTLTEAMGGAISVESRAGAGAAFHVALPLDVVAEAPPVDETPSFAIEDMTGFHVLIADDNEVNRLIASRFLEIAGCDVSLAETGREAVDQARILSPDLILMDGEMPELDGFSAARVIRREEAEAGRSRIPIIALSAGVTENQQSEAIKAGMDGFVAKPFQPAELLSAVTAARAKAEQGDAANKG